MLSTHHVVDNYVEIPKQLIPENFDYDEEVNPPFRINH